MNPTRPTSEILNSMPRLAQEAFDRANKAMKKRLAEQAAETQQQSESPTFNQQPTTHKRFMSYNTQVQNAAATSNSIDAGLKRAQILKEVAREFARIALPLKSFASVFSNVPLEGTDEIKVPYYPLPSNANSTYDYTTTDGYTFAQGTTTNVKTITIDRRKYQPLDFSSQELARQPQLRVVQLAKLAAESLAYQVLADVLSVVTAANFGPAGLIRPAAALSSDDLADLGGTVSDNNWPASGRSLIVGTGYDVQLKKDLSIKLALNIGGTEVLREGRVPNICGFDYYAMPNFPTNSEALGGFIVARDAIFFATAPIAPAPAVRQLLSAYQTIVDEQTGITLTWKEWGDCDRDRSKAVIEIAYGFAVGNPAALKRICTA